MIMGRSAICLTLCVLALGSSLRADNWPQWRGPNLNGSSAETALPEVLNDTTKLWEAKLPGHGAGTPIVFDDRIFVSAQERSSGKLLALCFDRDGKPLWSREMGQAFGSPPGGQNDMASPSAITDGKFVCFTFGTGDMAAFDMDGKQLWKRNIQKDHGAWNMLYLYGASPLLYKGRIYLQVLHRNVPVGYWGRPGPNDKLADSYLLAIDPATGKDIFRQIRKTEAVAETMEAYSTPMPFESPARSEIILVGGNCVTGHDPETGKELWRCGGWNQRGETHLRLVPTITIADDLFVVCTPKVINNCG